MNRRTLAHILILVFAATSLFAGETHGQGPVSPVATFSIVARDPANGELGVAVASRFFAVGSVVPYARSKTGAVATQAFANTTYGPHGLDLLADGLTAEETLKVLLRNDPDHEKRQVGIVAADGSSVSYSGPGCNAWAGGRNGPNYAVQGNILTGESVVIAMEDAFLHTKGTLAERMYAALLAGNEKGGDSRGKQSAALLVVREGAGYGGFSDRAIDLRVDDHQEPFVELGRLLDLALVNDAWNQGWTAFTRKQYAEAMPWIERAAALAPENPELLYDVAVIRLAAGSPDAALDALEKAVTSNPKLKKQASEDPDLEALRENARYRRIVGES